MEIRNGVLFASGKLAGALNGCVDYGAWPPDALKAPSVLLFLKKARGYLRDALAAMDTADEDTLGEAGWRRDARNGITRILAETRRLIREVRASLQADDGMT